jgi:hypothetical protein
MDQTRSSVPQGNPMTSARVTSPRGDTRADEAAATLGEKLESAAEIIRDRLPPEGGAGVMRETVGKHLEASGRYLKQQGVSGILEDVEGLIRQYPVQILLLGVGVGYLLSRLAGGRHG